MQSVTRSLLCALGAIVASLLTACGSGSGNAAPATIRVVNATSAAVTLSLNGTYSIANVASQSVSAYESVPPATYTTSVTGVNTSLTAGPSQTLGLGTSQNYTTLAYERDGVVYSATITDNLAIPGTGYATFNVANVSPDAGPLDVYLLAPGSTPQLGQATFQSVQGLSIASTFAAGTYDVIVTGAGKASDVRLTLPGFAFTSAQVGTIALTSTVGGSLVNAAVINQGGSAQFFSSNLARVRVMSALPQANQSAVNVTIGAATNLATVFAPNPNKYTLVQAGSAISAISVVTGATMTQTIAPPSVPGNNGTFAAGGDYTILVYGPPAAPVAEVLLDNNQTIPNYASVRLVNLAVSSVAGIALYVDSVQVASSVAYGAASAYAGVTPDSPAAIQVYGFGYTYTAPVSKPLVSGSVYSVFVYDAASPPLVIQDR